MDGLANKIKELIEKTYCCEYDREITAKYNENTKTYTAILHLHDEHFGGLALSAQSESEEDFLKFVEKELKAKRLDRSHHFKLKVYADN